MVFNIITIFPGMFNSIKDDGVVSRAIDKKIINLNTYNLREFSTNKYKNIDDAPYGGGGGMVMQVMPIRNCIKHIKQKNPDTKVIYLSPQGKKLSHKLAVELSEINNITLLCGRYEGVDQRIIDNDIDEQISIGDYVISGGELAAMVLIDAVSRQINGVLGNENSLNDSFRDDLLDFPHYTRPAEIDGHKVPEVLLSGNDKLIKEWRQNQAKIATKKFNNYNKEDK